ncbi:MAG: hypothetical protein NTV87_17825, partial [Ignavibacteriae bacterium]|nr:hypothetical protein [Ignavibacteriota bacterium]
MVFNNLSLCYPEKSDSWKRRITRGCYINLAITFFEILYFPKINKKLLEKIVSFENTDIIFESLRKGKGLFMLGGHISNWEMQASAFSRVLNARINGVAKPQTNSLVNKKIIEYRELGGSKVIE